MKTEKGTGRLEFFESLYEHAKRRQAEQSSALELNMEQYRGSTDIDGSSRRATAIRNITYELIEAQVHSDIPAPKVEPKCYSEKKDRNAKSIERLCAQLRTTLPFERLNDIDERYTYIYGASVWFVEWDNTIRTHSEVGGVRVHCINPRDFFPQPDITDLDGMEYCFLRFNTTRDALMRKYKISEEEAQSAQCEGDCAQDAESDTVCAILCFYKNETSDVCCFAWSGECILLDIDNYYKRKRRFCRLCGRSEELCVCDEPSYETRDYNTETLLCDVQRSDGSVIPSKTPVLNGLGELLSRSGTPLDTLDYGEVKMQQTALPYYTPKRFPIVIRMNTSKDGSLYGQSDCEFIRPEQQQINKLESRIMQKLLRAGITPIVPEDAQISLNNSIFGQMVKLKPGESVGMYGTIDTTPSISQDVLQSDRLYEHAKRIIGISDTYMGLNDSSAVSGRAKQLQVEQAAGRLESKRRMKQSAYSELDRIMFEYYLAYADEPREIAYKDAYGRTHNSQFNRYDFIEFDESTGEYYYDDGYLFSIDQNGAVEQQRELLWEKNLENLKSGTLGDPSAPITLLRYWQNQERAHYPHARENVEYFRSLLEGKDTEIKTENEREGEYGENESYHDHT